MHKQPNSSEKNQYSIKQKIDRKLLTPQQFPIKPGLMANSSIANPYQLVPSKLSRTTNYKNFFSFALTIVLSLLYILGLLPCHYMYCTSSGMLCNLTSHRCACSHCSPPSGLSSELLNYLLSLPLYYPTSWLDQPFS